MISKTCRLSKLVYFLPYLMFTLTTIPYVIKCILYHCVLLKLRYINFGNTVNPKQVRSCTFQANVFYCS